MIEYVRKDHSRDSLSCKDSFKLRLSSYSFLSCQSLISFQGNTTCQITRSKTYAVSFSELFRYQISFRLLVSMRRRIGKSKVSFLEISQGAPALRGLIQFEVRISIVQFLFYGVCTLYSVGHG